jgi:YD repeat-containing protein
MVILIFFAFHFHPSGKRSGPFGTGPVFRINRNTDQAYDRAGRMTQITDNLSDSTAYAYDKVSRLTLTSYADGGSDVVKQAYDKAGVLTKRIDQRGIATLYMYDSLHRLTKKQDDPSSPTIVETYALDALGRTTLAQLARGYSGDTHNRLQVKGGPLP